MDERRAGRAGVSDKWKTTDVSKVSVSLPECIKPTTIVHKEKEKKCYFVWIDIIITHHQLEIILLPEFQSDF